MCVASAARSCVGLWVGETVNGPTARFLRGRRWLEEATRYPSPVTTRTRGPGIQGPHGHT